MAFDCWPTINWLKIALAKQTVLPASFFVRYLFVPMSTTRHKGTAYESLAAALLEQKGFVIIARNYRWKRAEIDLIARKDALVVFVEVKGRGSGAFGYPEAFVSAAQKQRIQAAATAFLEEGEMAVTQIRFDIIAMLDGEDPVHFEDAF